MHIWFNSFVHSPEKKRKKKKPGEINKILKIRYLKPDMLKCFRYQLQTL